MCCGAQKRSSNRVAYKGTSCDRCLVFLLKAVLVLSQTCVVCSKAILALSQTSLSLNIRFISDFVFGKDPMQNFIPKSCLIFKFFC